MRTIIRFVRFSPLLLAFSILPQLASAGVASVGVLDNSYSPASITIQQGDTVTWTNYGSVAHTVTADSGFFQGNLAPGASFSFPFDNPGTYAYHDQAYGGSGGAGMSGSVLVIGTGGSTNTGGSSASALQAQAQALLAEISQLQQQLASGGSISGSVSSGGTAVINSSACPNIGRTLKPGSSGSDVSRLQQFLAQDATIYPEAEITGYYGALTQAAVERWQTRYNIVSSGTPATTGFGVVGPRTAAAIALLCSTGSTSGSTQTQTSPVPPPTVGGVLQVTPVSGPAPLDVSVQTTVDTVGSCAAATYVLNFGDGTQSTAIPVPDGQCQPAVQTYDHTYQYGGTYVITLTAGTHQTSASVTVSGSLPPSQSSSSGIPADSLHASIGSGAAPLTVVFTGTVSSLASFGCTGSCTDTINFGDGAVGLVQIPTTTGTWQSFIINHTFAAAGTYTVQLASVTGAADGPPITITVTGAASTPSPSPSPSPTPSGGSYAIVTVNPNVGGNPLAVSANLAVPASAPYQVNWGDNSSVSSGSGAADGSASASHTYSTAGTYTISLLNGSGTSEASAGVTISN